MRLLATVELSGSNKAYFQQEKKGKKNGHTYDCGYGEQREKSKMTEDSDPG